MPADSNRMVWFLSIVGIAVVVGMASAVAWAVREIFRDTAAVRLERILDPRDVVELNRTFAQVQRDILHGGE